MLENAEPTFIIEPLDPSKHDRAAFSCGVPQVDNFIKKTANKLTKADNLRVWIMTEDGTSIIGFYASTPIRSTTRTFQKSSLVIGQDTDPSLQPISQ